MRPPPACLPTYQPSTVYTSRGCSWIRPHHRIVVWNLRAHTHHDAVLEYGPSMLWSILWGLRGLGVIKLKAFRQREQPRPKFTPGTEYFVALAIPAIPLREFMAIGNTKLNTCAYTHNTWTDIPGIHRRGNISISNCVPLRFEDPNPGRQWWWSYDMHFSALLVWKYLHSEFTSLWTKATRVDTSLSLSKPVTTCKQKEYLHPDELCTVNDGAASLVHSFLSSFVPPPANTPHVTNNNWFKLPRCCNENTVWSNRKWLEWRK